MNTAFKNQVEQYLRRFFDLKIKSLRNADVIAAELCEVVRDFTLNGGKRIRALLIEYGYRMAGGRDKKLIVKIASAFELIHAFLLVHDDVIDRSDTRRFHKTIHVWYRDNYKKQVSHNAEHFGNSMAILAGDLALSLAYEILYSIDIKKLGSEEKASYIYVLQRVNKIIQETIVGETLDVVYSNIYLCHSRESGNPGENRKTFVSSLGKENTPNLDISYLNYNHSNLDSRFRGNDKREQIIHKIHFLKTAKYTVEGPLHTGLILAGADKGILHQVSKFAIPLGIAYQIKDDIDGVFGDKAKVGKSVTSDIQEGKLTLLVAKARERANKKQKVFLEKILGNPESTQKDLEIIKTIFRDTEALAYSQDAIVRLTKKARRALVAMKIKDDFLFELISYIEKANA